MPVQVLSHTFIERIKDILEYDIIQTVYNMDLADAISLEAEKRRVKAKVHLKINTGMNRVGFPAENATIRKIADVCALKGLNVEGIMSHFACADERDSGYTYKQFELFMDFCGQLGKNGIEIPLKHIANSAAFIRFPEMHLDMVRPGIAIYGHYPGFSNENSHLELKPAMSLKARIISVSYVSRGEGVSYGRTFTASDGSYIAAVPIGYADGFSRILSNRAKVIINGRTVPVVGTVCMDQFLADVSSIKNSVAVGDEVVLFGKQNGMEITAEELAGHAGTISYEEICGIGLRVPRIYIKNNDIIEVDKYLLKI